MPPARSPITLQQLLTTQFPPEDQLIGEGILGRGSKLIIGAPPKSYKGFLANTILIQLLTGGHLFGAFSVHSRQRLDRFPIKPVERVLLIEQELGEQGNQERLMPYTSSLSLTDQKKVAEGFHLLSCDYHLRLDEKDGLQRLNEVIGSVKPQVVCFDPLIKFHRREENNPSQMNLVMTSISKLAIDHNFTTIILHHFSKTNDSPRKGLDQLRGASAIAADLDSALLLGVQNRDAGIIYVEPQLKRGVPITPFYVKLDYTTLRMEFHHWQKSPGVKHENELVV